VRLPTRIRAAIGSLLLLALLLAAWQLATLPPPAARSSDPEYAAMLGARKSGLPAPAQVAQAAWAQLKNPFHDGGMNDKGIAIQLAWSLGRVLLGFALAALIAVPLGFFVGTSPVVHGALNPYVQLLKPISPLAWMPLALYTIKDSSISSVFVISICAVWPMLLNTAHGVSSVKREWLDVARTLEVSAARKAASPGW
jgi:nitrate/nitrite transport system permease protein